MAHSDPNKVKLPIVGIGASAGGLEALEHFFLNMPIDSGMAFVIVLHLNPKNKDYMAELLQRQTNMPVRQVTATVDLQPNHVYVIPPNKNISVSKGKLYLLDLPVKDGLRLPIDFFFDSLAKEKEEKSIAIILSGMGSDGSLGLKTVRDQNGIILVQDPKSSKFNSMPKSAIAAVSVDCIANADKLPVELIGLLEARDIIQKKILSDKKHQNNLDRIITMLRAQTGHDFSKYKKNTVYRRIERRMGVHRLLKMESYIDFLKENKNEVEILFKEMLIGVTNFFRDDAVWGALKEKVLPKLILELPKGHVFRVWTTGCSTGEEAYSFAILFREVCETLKMDTKVTLQVFATDINSDAIQIARKGIYGSAIEAHVSPDRLKRFFTKKGTTYTINSFIREMIVFAPHNILYDPPFTKLDFLLCRNVLIYMEPELQKKVMNLFFYSLNQGGIMVLGTSENANTKEALFTVVDAKLKIYRRTLVGNGIAITEFPSPFSKSMKFKQSNVIAMKDEENIQSFADQFILDYYAPASVMINPDGDILYITGRTGQFLEPATGKANMNIYAMAREGLQSELFNAIRRVKQQGRQIKLNNVKILNNGNALFVDVTVHPIEKPICFKGMMVIIFADVSISTESLGRSKTGKRTANAQVQKLEAELQHALHELQSIREEMQSSQEELKSTNEELQSTNEELQSTNEELTTSKEEMQSMNEELQTVNNELESKVREFSEANSDMINLLNSTDVATLFLDKKLNIRKFTDEVKKVFKLRPSDVGRPFVEVVSDLHYPKIEEHAKEVLRTLIYKENEISATAGRWYTVKIMPYRTMDDRIDGLVLTFIDISNAKKIETELKEKLKLLQKHNLLSNEKAKEQ